MQRRRADPAIRAGLTSGYAEARKVIQASLQQRSAEAGPWGFGRDVGRFGYNYLQRSVTNTLGTGGNVRDENGTFLTFRDAAGAPLDGSSGRYRLLLDPPPPGRYFWSVTLYDARTRQLHPNPLRRYTLGDRSQGLVRTASGGAEIIVQADPPAGKARANWLPAPRGPFYLAIRAQGPAPEVVSGEWRPRGIEKVSEK